MIQENKRQKLSTEKILRKFFPKECVDKILDDADYHNFETMEYWKEISKQPKVNRFPVGKMAKVGCWEGWIGNSHWDSDYIINLCHNCAGPCSIYGKKIYKGIGYHATDWCSYECMVEGESYEYARYEKMHYKYGYD